MTQIFTEAGELIPVTVIEATPNVVLQVKTVETDGYNAIQVGFDDKRQAETVGGLSGGWKMKLDLPSGVNVEIKL